MKHIYDILVNFKTEAYEFYEWTNEDEIKHIKTILAIKVKDSCIYDFLNNNVKVQEDFLKKIKGNTKFYRGRIIKEIDYACVIYNEDIALAIEFNSEGLITGRSKLLFDESDDIVSCGKKEVIYEIDYEVLSKRKLNFNLTRKEKKLVYILTKYLNVVFEKKSYDEIKYFYFECFNDNELDAKKAYLKLNASVLKADYDVINKLKDLIKVLKK